MQSNKEEGSQLFSNQALRSLLIPLLIELTLTLAVGMIDSVMVASAGEAAVSGVSLVDTVMQLLIHVFQALATGGAVVAGQYIGHREKDKAQEAAGQLIWFSGLFSLLVAILFFSGHSLILKLLYGKITREVYGFADIYLIITACSIPAIAVFEAGAAVFRTMGNARVTMEISMLMNGINAVLNAVFIYGFHMATKGAALATLIARVIAAVVITVLLLNQNLELHLNRTIRYRFNAKMVGDILRIGVPNGVENGMFQLGKVIVVSLVAGLGTAEITAHAVTQTIANVQVIPGMAVNTAAITVISYCVGAGDNELVRYYNRKLQLISYGALFVTIGLSIIFLPGILSLYGLSEITAKMTTVCILIHGIGAIFLWTPTFVLPAVLRAAGDVKFAMILSVCSMWIFRIGFAHFAVNFFHWGVPGVWVAMIVDWIFRSIVFVFRFRSGKWQGKGVVG